MKYKLALLAAVMLLVISHSFSQVHFGIKGGVNLATTKDVRNGSKMRAGLNAGIFTDISVAEKFLIRPEILYSVKGHKFPASNTFNSAGTLSLHYVSIPLLAGYHVMDKLIVLAGPEFNFRTKANSRFDNEDHDVSENFRKFDMAIDIGAAYLLTKGLGVEIRYSHGFADLMDVTYTTPTGIETGNDRIGSNHVIQAGLFYRFSK